MTEFETDIPFNRAAVRPMDCFRHGWNLIRDEYWLFWSITFLGAMLAGMGPFGILLGPFMCGIHLCFLCKESGGQTSFNMLFKGFDYFMPGLVASLIMMVPIILMVIVLYICFFASMSNVDLTGVEIVVSS